MAKPIEILDPVFDWGEASPTTGLNIAPLRVGTDWEPGDVRIVWLYIDYATGTTAEWTIGATPAGWTKFQELAPTGTSLARTCLFRKTLAAGDTDTTVTFGGTVQFRSFRAVSFTLRNQEIAGTITSTTQYVAATTAAPVAPSITTGTGIMVCVYHFNVYPEHEGITSAAAPGQTKWIAGEKYFPHDGGVPGFVEFMLSYESRTGGTSGSRTAALGANILWYAVSSIFIPQAPDVTATIGKAAVVSTARSTSITLQNLTTGVIGQAMVSATARPLYTPLSGYRTSPVFALPTAPVSASQITWTETSFAAGATVVVQTTVDGGLTWQQCTNGGVIPRLPAGSAVIRQIQYRVTVTRALISDPSPRVQRVELKVASDDSHDELVPLGVFLLNDTVVTETADPTSGGVTVQLSGVDLSRLVARNSWDDVYIIKGGIDYADAIRMIVDNRLPGLTYEFTETGHLTPRLLFGHQQGGDAWQDAQDLATAIGWELYFNPFGVCCLRPIADPKIDGAVWEFNDSSHPTITSITRTITDASTFNRVVVYGESMGGAPPVYAVAVDDDPASPTYYLGPYGTVTTVFTTSMITSVAQAQEAADALLRLVRGATEMVDIAVIPNPALEPGDVVTIEVAGAKLTGRFLVNRISTPLGSDQPQTLTCYRQ